mmetsp:Transcript_17695/g.30110  ORF Transcript_17695/g.30110 Transcript_17695/m.30110 type:complete len:419 (-) Transcript_17695:210-1466(-)
MSNESNQEHRPVARHWKLTGLLAGGVAAAYVLLQERERVAGALEHVQDRLTGNGLTLVHKLSAVADRLLVKVHETFVAAAPHSHIEAAVCQGLTGHAHVTTTTTACPKGGRVQTRMARQRQETADKNEDKSEPTSSNGSGQRKRSACDAKLEADGNTQPQRRTLRTGERLDTSASTQVQEALEHSRLTAADKQVDHNVSLSIDSTGADAQVAAAAAGMSGNSVMAKASPSLIPEPIDAGATSAVECMATRDAQSEVSCDLAVSTCATSISQRAQTEPASLLGARLSALWVDEAFICEVMMIRQSDSGTFEALVKYEADDVEQWEVIGEPPYCHVIVEEPADAWSRKDNELIDARTLEHIDGKEFEGVVVAWLKAGYENVTLFKVYHTADGDFEDLEEQEVKAAVSLYNARTADQVGNA